MIQKTYKRPKIALCRRCGGAGQIINDDGKVAICPQCEGSGRVTVSGEMTLDIRPYHPKNKERKIE